jgi:hypothetical protein
MRLWIPDFDAVIDTRWFAGLWTAGDYGYDGTEPNHDWELHCHSTRRLLPSWGGENDVELTQQYVFSASATLHSRRILHDESNAGSHRRGSAGQHTYFAETSCSQGNKPGLRCLKYIDIKSELTPTKITVTKAELPNPSPLGHVQPLVSVHFSQLAINFLQLLGLDITQMAMIQ